MSRQLKVFMERLVKLNAIEFIGVARMLGIDVAEGKELREPGKEFSELFAEMVEKFEGLDRRRRRNLIGIMKKAGRK